MVITMETEENDNPSQLAVQNSFIYQIPWIIYIMNHIGSYFLSSFDAA